MTDRATEALEPDPDDDATAAERAVELMAATSTSRLELGPGVRSFLLGTPQLEIPDPAVLQHLAVLEADGLVHSEKVGRVRTCRIEPAALRTAGDWVAERRARVERSLDRLGDYLAQEKTRRTKKGNVNPDSRYQCCRI